VTIWRICQRDVDTATLAEDIHAAAQRMESRCVGTLVVLDEHEHPIGIITDRDIALRVVGQGRNPEETSVGDVMTRSPKTLPEAAPLSGALAAMQSEGVRRLPVVDEAGRLVGMVSLDDVVRQVAEDLAHVSTVIGESSPRALAGT
jgi:CBS domain-containing protein